MEVSRTPPKYQNGYNKQSSSVKCTGKSRKGSKANKGPNYIMLNVSPTKTSEKEREIVDAHNRVFDDQRKVKFSDMKYDLGDLFDNVPAFDAPTLLFNQKDGVVPQELEFPLQRKGDG